jgi:predicted RNA polymerase sigma factor
MACAKRRAIDRFRREKRFERAGRELGRELEGRYGRSDLDPAASVGEEIKDDVLRLMFTVCHPILASGARTALALKTLAGLSTEQIARAYLVSEATIAQRIVRAKRTLREAAVPFEVPSGPDRSARFSSVLEVIYLIFNEGYAATSGDAWTRPELCEDALRLGRMAAELEPNEAEAHGLVALMEIQASRLASRVGPSGEPILLLDQDRSRWDRLLIRRGFAALERARSLGVALGPYALQASIAAYHARAATAADTDWAGIAALYDALSEISPSPVVALNRAIAYSMAYGPAAALPLVDELLEEPSLGAYHLLPGVRGDLLLKLGRETEARAEFLRAASLAGNGRERDLLLRRAERLGESTPDPAPLSTGDDAAGPTFGKPGGRRAFLFICGFVTPAAPSPPVPRAGA